MHIQPARLVLTTLTAVTLLALSACGDKADKPAATQVAAKVGSEEISIHQINQVLSRTNMGNATPEAVAAMKREVLEKLIIQQLAVDQATEDKLHRSPEVVAQIEAARREVLASAYMQKIARTVAKPTPDQVNKYYTDHPQLFAQRRVFNVQEIIMAQAPGLADQLRGIANTMKDINEATSWLKSQGIKFGGGAATRSAEQIPLEILPKIHELKDGQNAVLESQKTVTLVHLVASQTSPISEADAKPRIEKFLTNQRANDAVSANLKQLRTNAQVTYLGEFAQTATTAAPAATPAPATGGDPAQSIIEKGVAGLK